MDLLCGRVFLPETKLVISANIIRGDQFFEAILEETLEDFRSNGKNGNRLVTMALSGGSKI